LTQFQFNYNKNPNQFTTLTETARGSSANGEYAEALDFANKALQLAPNDSGRQAVQAMIEKLKTGRDINSGSVDISA
jgi:Flp pilus assembly protein TadD